MSCFLFHSLLQFYESACPEKISDSVQFSLRLGPIQYIVPDVPPPEITIYTYTTGTSVLPEIYAEA